MNDDHDTGPDLLADLIDEAARAKAKGESTAEIAHRVWPLFKAAVLQAINERDEDRQQGVHEWRRINHELKAATGQGGAGA